MPHEAIEPWARLQMQAIGATIGEALPDGFGFALLVFRTDTSDGRMNYISNANRTDMLTAMKEFIANAEGRMAESGRPQ